MTKKRYALLLAAAWLAVCFAAACIYAAKCGTYFIDADMSSELVLARQLSREGGVLSKNWYYSSELRVLNNQLVFAPLFALSDNWQLVRTLGTAITLAVMTACYIFMARGTGLSWTGTFASAGVLLLPLSDSYTYAVLTGLFYIPHICISFLLFGLYCRYTGAGRKKPLWGVLAAVLAFIAGLGGVRQLFIFTVPAFITAVILLFENGIKMPARGERMEFAAVSALSLIASAAGCLVNRGLLPQIYSFCNYGENTYGRDVLFTGFSLDGFKFYIDSIIELFGYRSGPLFSGVLVYNMLFGCALLAAVFAVRAVLRDKAGAFRLRAETVFFITAFAMLGLVYCFTDLDRVVRYCVPVFVFAVPVVFASFERWRAESRVKLAPAALMAALLVLCSANTYRVSSGYDANSDLKDIVSVVRGEGYTEGYSSFWTGNLITELSSGAVDMRIVGGDMIVEPGDMAYVYEWLQAKAHKDTVPAGRFFLVLFNFEAELPIEPIYTNQMYRLYDFDSFDEFEALYK